MIKTKVPITVIALLVLSSSSFVAAQNSEIDSLEYALKTAKSDSSRFDVLKTICFKIVGVDSAKTEMYCSRLIGEVESVNDPVEKADAYAAIGDYYNSKLDFRNSLEYFHKSIEIFKHAGGSRAEIAYAKCLLDYAYVFHINGDFATALTSDLEAESILDKYQEYDTKMGMYNRLGDIYSKLHQREKSISYVKKAEEISDKILSPKMKALYYINKTYTLDYKKDFDKIRELIGKSLSIADKYSLQEFMWIGHYTLGDYLLSREEYVDAIAQFNSALRYAQKLSNKYDESSTIEDIGDAYTEQKKYDVASEQYLLALSLAKEINAAALERNIYGSLSSIEVSRGNYRKANEYLSKKEDAIYQIFDEEDQKQINFLNAKYESEKKETEIRRLTYEEKIQSLEMERRRILIYVLSAFLVLLAVAFFFVLRYYQSRKKIIEQNNQIQKQKIRELEKEKQLVAVRYALQGEEKERSRLARDLHDGLGGLLSGAKMALGSFKESYVLNEDQADSFKHALDLLNKSIGELQRVAHNMMPQALINGTIKDAVGEFCEKIDAGSSLSLKFQSYGDDEKIGQNHQIAVYRIIQELVNNIIKHSGATEALVQLVQEKDRISVAVQDNGKGFDPSTATSSEGHGLKNIRMRVESLGGRLDIDSGIGKGTEISFEFEGLEK